MIPKGVPGTSMVQGLTCQLFSHSRPPNPCLVQVRYISLRGVPPRFTAPHTSRYPVGFGPLPDCKNWRTPSLASLHSHRSSVYQTSPALLPTALASPRSSPYRSPISLRDPTRHCQPTCPNDDHSYNPCFCSPVSNTLASGLVPDNDRLTPYKHA